MWYIIFNGQQVGPIDKYQLVNYNLNPSSLVWHEGMPDWQPAGGVPELQDVLYPGSAARPPYVPSGKKIVAGIFALLLGWLGIQYFYLGKIGAGLLTILLTCVTCGVWELITFAQGIVMLTMSDQEFDRKFVYTNSFFPIF